MMNEQKGNEEELKVNITLPSLVQPQICPWLVEHYLGSHFIPPLHPPLPALGIVLILLFLTGGGVILTQQICKRLSRLNRCSEVLETC